MKNQFSFTAILLLILSWTQINAQELPSYVQTFADVDRNDETMLQFVRSSAYKNLPDEVRKNINYGEAKKATFSNISLIELLIPLNESSNNECLGVLVNPISNLFMIIYQTEDQVEPHIWIHSILDSKHQLIISMEVNDKKQIGQIVVGDGLMDLSPIASLKGYLTGAHLPRLHGRSAWIVQCRNVAHPGSAHLLVLTACS
jgi:hypothetical protein